MNIRYVKSLPALVGVLIPALLFGLGAQRAFATDFKVTDNSIQEAEQATKGATEADDAVNAADKALPAKDPAQTTVDKAEGEADAAEKAEEAAQKAYDTVYDKGGKEKEEAEKRLSMAKAENKKKSAAADAIATEAKKVGYHDKRKKRREAQRLLSQKLRTLQRELDRQKAMANERGGTVSNAQEAQRALNAGASAQKGW